MSADLIHHQLAGEGGEAVLFLNGGMMTLSSWEPVTAGLPQRYRTLLCDFRGQLLSPGDSHRRLEDNVADVVALLDAHDLERVHLFGASFGGEVAVLLAALHPSRVQSLVAATAVDRPPAGMRRDAQRMRRLARAIADGADPGPFHQVLVDNVYSPAYRESQGELLAERSAKVALLPPSWYRGLLGILASVEEFDLSPLLGRIECPTLVLHAAGDTLMPEARVRALAEGIDGAELEIHPAAGHALVMEDPAWVSGRYGSFLARRAGEGAAARRGAER